MLPTNSRNFHVANLSCFTVCPFDHFNNLPYQPDWECLLHEEETSSTADNGIDWCRESTRCLGWLTPQTLTLWINKSMYNSSHPWVPWDCFVLCTFRREEYNFQSSKSESFDNLRLIWAQICMHQQRKSFSTKAKVMTNWCLISLMVSDWRMKDDSPRRLEITFYIRCLMEFFQGGWLGALYAR